MLQLLTVALLGYIAFRFFTSLKKASLTRKHQEAPTHREVPSINTVRCAQCGVHIAATDAVYKEGASSPAYCCKEHAHQG
ncbi:PP0621 family protein [Carnimonas nigrificans]|uniref:PP0621 family protein n=1 Tax=Carnimonas nigrificans TaxID=64323 RepID=UPI0004717EE2|nr:PP0621 family protein [Carnimonas nigrificans]